MTKEFSLVEEMDKYLCKPRHLVKSRLGLYPSEASVSYHLDGRTHTIGKCLRAVYYRLMKDKYGAEIEKDDKPNPGLMAKALIGKWDELAIVDTVKKMGIFEDHSVKFFQPALTMSGELDMIVKNPNTNGLILYEIKSYYNYYADTIICGTKPKIYKTKDNVSGIPGTPKNNQFLQAVLYSWEYKDLVEETRMLYLERGDGHRVEFKVGTINSGEKHFCYWEQVPGPYWTYMKSGKCIQPYTIEDIHERYIKVGDYFRNKELPPMDYETKWDDEKVEWGYKNNLISKSKYDKWKKGKENIGNWECNYCDWKKQCKKDFLKYGY